nr:MAG TPA: hypothetical protein [Caudoviricetes sp.]
MIIWSKCRNKFTAQKNTIMSRIKSAAVSLKTDVKLYT